MATMSYYVSGVRGTVATVYPTDGPLGPPDTTQPPKYVPQWDITLTPLPGQDLGKVDALMAACLGRDIVIRGADQEALVAYPLAGVVAFEVPVLSPASPVPLEPIRARAVALEGGRL